MSNVFNVKLYGKDNILICEETFLTQEEANNWIHQKSSENNDIIKCYIDEINSKYKKNVITESDNYILELIDKIENLTEGVK